MTRLLFLGMILTILVGCSATLGEDARCVAPDKDACLRDTQCAWGTNRDGPHCFWVGDVRLQ